MTIIIHDKISEEPEIDCGHSAIMIKVKTSRQKPSYIFAKGYFRKEGCIFNNTDTANFTLEQCNINKKRQINPRGMAYSMTVIVQLHPLFITKVDRAYNIRCFYMEANKIVDAELDVSELTTSILDSGHVMPQCSYTLHRDSANGPILRYARVGDIIYHVWDCPSDVYVMLVHSCFILDGQGGEHKVIDSYGSINLPLFCLFC
ncbi:unnamed protein product [Dracunculus medinensis]|uniref:ZP domain-containing protein n=1 Tax=Dracunculus medinensis TaxID=318479 RepID=A0A0N4UPC6_DRAME|nr:unnamed protein product [Dracunculus medinensis]